MLFRSLILLLLGPGFSLSICAQDYKTEIEKDFAEYLNAITNKEFEKSMAYILPEFFEIFPREQMIQLMDQTFNDPSVEFEFKNPEILKVDDREEIEDKYYALLSYSHQMNMKIYGQEDETAEAKSTRIKLTRMSLEQTFGLENVNYNPDTDFFEILSTKDVYAISDNGERDWKYLVIESEQIDILEQLIPGVLIDRLY